LLHLGDDVKWNRELYAKLQSRFNIMRSYSMNRDEFKLALQHNRFGDFVAIYRPFWNTGGEMGRWDEELMYAIYQKPFPLQSSSGLDLSFHHLAEYTQVQVLGLTG
jgi:hypothetical protein